MVISCNMKVVLFAGKQVFLYRPKEKAQSSSYALGFCAEDYNSGFRYLV